MSTDDLKLTVGRGGRGAAILKALQSLPPYPGQTSGSVEQASAQYPDFASRGAGVQIAGATALSSPRSDVSVTSAASFRISRGAAISQLIQQKSAIVAPGASIAEMKERTRIESGMARGCSELLHAHFIENLTTQPGAKPLKSAFQEFGDTSSLTESLQNLSTIDSQDEVVVRQGSTGAKLSAMCNWIRLHCEENKSVFEYEVKFEPQIEILNLRFRLFDTLRDKIGSVKSFDGTTLWLPFRLPTEVALYHAANPSTGKTVTLKILYKKKTDMDKCIQLYNVLFNRIMKVLKLARVGKNYYAPGESVLVPQHKADLHQMHRSNFKNMAVRALVGCIVLTRYNNKSYRIDDIIFNQNPRSTFTNYKGEEISYVDYYFNTYGIKIKDLHQPLLLHRRKKKDVEKKGSKGFICLIPELSYMTGLTDDMRSDFRVMKDIAQHTRLTPTVRQASLRAFVKNVNSNREACQVLADWGLRLEDNAVALDGRVLPPETIFFGCREVPGSEIADWGRDACREKVITPVDLQSGCWSILFCPRDKYVSQKFVAMFKQVTLNMGIRVGEPQTIQLSDDKIESYVNSLKHFYHDKLQIAVIIFPTQRDDRYAAVKRLACVELALPTQCINSRTISQDSKLRSVTQKIALQINCKLGGELWALKIPMTGLMVCGVDVYHDPTRRGESVVGFVASINQTLTKWYSHVSFQHPADEIVHGLKMSLLESLRHYHKLYHVLPRSIIMYRDGVSEGQLKLVEDHELPQLATIFHHFASYEPKLYLIVVQKRVNTRIFAAMRSRELGNPPPGSIIDHTITRRCWYDFLLVSQHVRQGTVSPTHYVVVHDGGKLKVDNMQRLTYKLTHLYYNWPGTIRVPAPCQYAHKLAFLVGESVKKHPDNKLCDRLFFL
ncbi:piwi-like protein Ago3 isoform X2 [Cherax quadricarinatus]